MTLGLPVVGPEVKVWANDMRRFLSRQWDRLSYRRAGQTASDDGIILWDATSGYPVVSLDGEWQEIVLGSASFDIAQAERVVLSTYTDTVSVKAKAKNLNKFGLNETVGTTFETVAQFQGTTANETYVSTNAIDSIVSSSASDAQTIKYEGHTIDGSGNLTFASDEVTLTGQTPVTLPTAVARLNRMFIANSGTFNSPQAVAVGQIVGYDSSATTVTGGVPNTAASVKALIKATEAQTQKCATSISSQDYWFVTAVDAGIGQAGGNASRVLLRLEVRDVANGGLFRPLGRDLTLAIDQNGVQQDESPFLICPPNHDIRVVARTDSNTASVFAEVRGYLASIQ